MRHIEFETLLKYFESSLSAAAEREVAAHLNACRDCAGVRNRLGTFFDYVREESEFEAVPQAVTANLLNIYKPPPRLPEKRSFVRTLAAKLVFDDWRLALNERFVLSDTRQLLYRAGDFDIDLRLHFAGEKCRVSGQVFPDCRRGAATLIGEKRAEAVFNGDCEFFFEPVETGDYRLQIELDDVRIELPQISLVL
ncbi:MAG: hypothetical protein JSS81_22150 [Acidobacteria bacterium]|nr:hypothetical protein [Acidobacteriota bacterium]